MIEEALHAAQCVVVVWTKAAVLSEWVRIEAALARERGIIAPVFLEDVPLPIAFRHIQTASLVDWDGSDIFPGLAGLQAGIRAILSGPGPQIPSSITAERALDAAIPRLLPVQESANLIAMLRRRDSTGLKGILESDDEYGLSPADVVSKAIEITHPMDAAGRALPADILMRVISPGFDPPMQEKRIRVLPDRDSTICSFLLRPIGLGSLILQVDLYQRDACVASRILRIDGVPSGRVRVAVGHHVVSMPLVVNVSGTEFNRMAAAASPQWSYPPAQQSPPLAPTLQIPARPAQAPAPRSFLSSTWAKAGVAFALLVLSVPAILLQFPNLLRKGALPIPPSSSQDTGTAPLPSSTPVAPPPVATTQPAPTQAQQPPAFPVPDPQVQPAPVSPALVPAAVQLSVSAKLQDLENRQIVERRKVSEIDKDMQRQGLLIRLDVLTADRAVEEQLQAARAEIEKSNYATAAEHLQEAETQLAFLERYLGQ